MIAFRSRLVVGWVIFAVLIVCCANIAHASGPSPTPAPMTMPGMQNTQAMSNPELAPASPVNGVNWSIFNHRVSGLFILLWGLTALISGLLYPRAIWLRFLAPLWLLGLVEFLILRNDPKAWPTGPIGFWISFRDPAVTEHRIFVVLILAIAIVELLRAASRLPRILQIFALPGLAVFGAVLLFFHHHGGLEAQQMMQRMSDPSMASNPAMQSMKASMKVVKGEHLLFSLSGFGLAAAKLPADAGLLKGRLGATLWTIFAIALGAYMMGYTE